ncbi:hypothetical protein [Saccharopolyspora pogona]|uniref:hypothetical protein n=1 Tax=Saccharopolyspora pogona TaxID=333966 RepID=UPI00168784AB|nr:hypothetical protein [Saccharopolyspora pogona]
MTFGLTARARQPRTVIDGVARRGEGHQVTLRELVEQMERRWEELMTLRASPDMYGSESLDGQLSELELWLLRMHRLTAGTSAA